MQLATRPTPRGAHQREADVNHSACASPFYTVEQFARRNPVFTLASLRWMIFQRETNGLQDSGAILRNGRSIVIDEPAFFAWFRSQCGAR
jgi:hypothetical protein